MAACSRAMVLPPRALPMATDQRGTGATSTSLRKPNSLSHTMDMAENTDVNSTDMPIMPGYINSR